MKIMEEPRTNKQTVAFPVLLQGAETFKTEGLTREIDTLKSRGRDTADGEEN